MYQVWFYDFSLSWIIRVVFYVIIIIIIIIIITTIIIIIIIIIIILVITFMQGIYNYIPDEPGLA